MSNNCTNGQRRPSEADNDYSSTRDGVDVPLTPFLKWPGGKRWLTERYSHFLPNSFRRYIEPFLGSGAVYFHLKPKSAILSDINSELIAAYCAVKNDAVGITWWLNAHQEKHKRANYYYSVRQSAPRTATTKAARLIYLNRTCFNGIYRVNLKGQFNVPKGTKSAVILDADDFNKARELLLNADLYVADFEDVISEAGKGDFIFADPPYTVRHNFNAFVKYNERLFSWDDQIRLALALAAARDRGATIVATNANHSSVKELYRAAGFSLKKLSRYSSISALPESRETYDEILIRS
jgi:DNA adenine methylase